jgi:uncharacterized protein YggE
MRRIMLAVCAVLALPPVAIGQVDADEVNRNLQGGGNLTPTPMQGMPGEGGLISVDGRGEAAGPPDLATITSGVTTQAASAREALDANSAAIARLISALAEAGIEGRDIQTSEFSIQPQYVYPDQPDSSGYSQPPRIVGYQVANRVTVRVRDLSRLGAVLDRAVSVGANTIDGISFTVADATALYAEARRKAFADALAKAELYAALAGVELGGIEIISEGTAFAPPLSIGALAREAVAAAVPIETGEASYVVTVQVTWRLRQ